MKRLIYIVLLSGTIFTGRDEVHKYLHKGGELDVIKNGVIYHCGPVVLEENGKFRVVAAGPTTSIREEPYQADVIKLSLRSNARAKMRNHRDGFIKIFARKGSGTVIGGVVVGPNASELIFAISIAVTQKLHVDDIASTFTVYPSLSGSISEAARRLHVHM